MIETLLNYDASLDRTTVINLLPFILSEIRNYTNQYFLTLTNMKVTKIEDGKLYVSDDPSNVFDVGDTIEIMNSENNKMIYQIKSFDNNTITLEQSSILNETKNDNMVAIKLAFGGVNLKTISNMLNYEIKFGSTNGIKSQSLGGYSVTYATPTGSDTLFPLELYGGINALKKLNDDYAEYRRKGYVRL